MEKLPLWIAELADDELTFVKRFILSSGSLKEMAEIYGVTYPTVRNRLNNIIYKIRQHEDSREDSYVKLIKKLTFEEKIDFDAATVLIHEYRNRTERENNE